jgi:type I restriction-modification system DNA methylase subunit
MKETLVPKLTEDTITAMLRDELERRNVSAQAFVGIRTPAGYRKPDILCQNGGVYIIEAKFKERDLWKAVAKIQNDYIRYSKFLNLAGAFAVLYPEELSKPLPREVIQKLAKTLKFKVIMMFLPEDKRKNFHVIRGTLPEIADELVKQILTPPEFIEPSIDYIINTLRDIANVITTGLAYLSGEQLQNLFGGRDVFENILQYEEGKYPVEDLRLASAYILVNQLLFYHVLSKRVPQIFKEIIPDSLKSPSDLKYYFLKVLDINYKTIFSYDVVSYIPQRFIGEIREIINAIQGLTVEKVGGDLLGMIFHDLIPFDIRKKVAAFYTNVMAAHLLAWLAIDRWDAIVADFACGSGGLLVAAYKRKKELLEREKEFTEEDHRKFVEEHLLGVDVMPFAANIAACHLALQSPQFFTNKVRIAVWDSTELIPGIKIPSVSRLEFVLRGQQTLSLYMDAKTKKQKGVIKLTDEEAEEIELERFDVVIMNPPFTRQERMPKQYKELLLQRFKEYSSYLHGQMSYYAYFILLADKFLKEGGRLAFVLPAAFLKTKNVERIRKLIAEKYQIEYIITGKRRLNFSEATWRREILLLAKKLKPGEEKSNVSIVVLKSLPKISDLEKLTIKIKTCNDNYTDDEIIIKSIKQNELEEDLDWFKFIASFSGVDISEIWENISHNDKLIPFGELYQLDAVMKRGIETAKGMKVQAVFIPRSRERAIRKEDYWILHKEENEYIIVKDKETAGFTIRIPRDALTPALRTIAGNPQMDLSENFDFVITKDFQGSEDFFIGERASLRNVLPRWEEYVSKRKGNLIILRRFPINAPGTIHLCYYASKPVAGPGMTWVLTIPDEEAKILCLWFNSSLHLAQILYERVEDVWLDIHKYILQNMLVLNPRKIDEKEKKELLTLFDKIRNTPFPTLKEQFKHKFALRNEIDRLILKILGFSEEESEIIAMQLSEGLKEHFEMLELLSKKD